MPILSNLPKNLPQCDNLQKPCLLQLGFGKTWRAESTCDPALSCAGPRIRLPGSRNSTLPLRSGLHRRRNPVTV